MSKSPHHSGDYSFSRELWYKACSTVLVHHLISWPSQGKPTESSYVNGVLDRKFPS
jgi:hypothetical protein